MVIVRFSEIHSHYIATKRVTIQYTYVAHYAVFLIRSTLDFPVQVASVMDPLKLLSP